MKNIDFFRRGDIHDARFSVNDFLKRLSRIKIVLEGKMSGKTTGKTTGKTQVETPVKTQVKKPVKTTEKIIELLKENNEMTLAAIATEIGKSLSAVERAAATLVKSGKLKYVGPKKSGHWEVLE